MTSSTATAPRRARSPAKPGISNATKSKRSRAAVRRRELERIVGPMVRRLVAQEIEDQIDRAAARAALAEGGEPVPIEEVFRRLGW